MSAFKTTSLTVEVVEVGELIPIKRKGKPDLNKIMMVVRTSDNQVFYPEVRNSNLKKLNNIYEGDIVKIEYSLQGSEKSYKRYNNIVIEDIIKIS